jgi:hypothetical protein
MQRISPAEEPQKIPDVGQSRGRRRPRADALRNALAPGDVIAILRVWSMRCITETPAILACLVGQTERPRHS